MNGQSQTNLRIKAMFALSGAKLTQPINRERGDGIFYQLPGDQLLRSSLPHGYCTMLDAMKAALEAMGVEL